MKIEREKAVKLFYALGRVDAHRWDGNRFAQEFNKLPEDDFLTADLYLGEYDDLLCDCIEAVEGGTQITVTGFPASEKTPPKKPVPKKKAAPKTTRRSRRRKKSTKK